MLVAASPSWFADNITQISLVALVVTTGLVLKLVSSAVTRTVLLALIAVTALFVYANRDALQACAKTCECQVADRDITVPFCDPVELG